MGKSGFGCSCGKKNQTPKDVFTHFTQKTIQKDSLGTGLFLVPAPQIGILEVEVVIVQDLTYSECMKRGNMCVAYKWIPTTIMGHDDIVKNRQSESSQCSIYYCEEASDCPSTYCICYEEYSSCL